MLNKGYRITKNFYVIGAVSQYVYRCSDGILEKYAVVTASGTLAELCDSYEETIKRTSFFKNNHVAPFRTA